MNSDHSPKYEMIKSFYNSVKPSGTRMWTEKMVSDAVVKNWITAAEFEEITGKKYAA